MDIQASAFSLSPIVLISAFILDAAIGDPRALPHPVRIIGRAISSAESFLRRSLHSPAQEKMGGIILVFLIVVPVFVVTLLAYKAIFHFLPHSGFPIPATILLVYLTATTIAARELIDSARLVTEAVRDAHIDSARKRLSMIVGRDTDKLPKEGILKATIETLAENLSDGVIAPLFYLSIGGLPLAITYKAINTLDSMVGYRNDKYINFGWAAAKLDDIANYLPARLTGLLISLSSLIISHSPASARSALATMLRDGRKHLSPNSGIPEAAMAGALGVRLGGPSIYGGVVVEKPFIGDGGEKDYLSSARKAMNVVRAASILCASISAAVLYVRSSF